MWSLSFIIKEVLRLTLRKFKRKNLSLRISEYSPSFCMVHAASKGNISSVRPLSLGTQLGFEDVCSSTISANSPPCLSSSLESGSQSLHIGKAPQNSLASLSMGKVAPTTIENMSWMSHQLLNSVNLTVFSNKNNVNIDLELASLRVQLKNVRRMYAITQTETIDARRKLDDMNKRWMKEWKKLREIITMEERAREAINREWKQYEAAKSDTKHTRDCAEIEASQRGVAEKKAAREVEEKRRLENALLEAMPLYQNFTWEEIVSATSSFSESLRIGAGSHGAVYKAYFHHTTAAVKVNHSKGVPNSKQFQQELEILSRIRHPHLLLLMGADPGHGCLVCEYMENGSLGDRLLRRWRANTPPIPWPARFRIAREAASALAFLHGSKPDPIIHRDLKPDSILLDRNWVSKIGDARLSKIIQHEDSSSSSYFTAECTHTGILGTLGYIDPEYQRTGTSSPESDVYAFGMVILQLLTARPALALAQVVETAIKDDRMMDILDWEAGEWPHEETKDLMKPGLSCSELRRRDRPGLKDWVLPALCRLEGAASGMAQDWALTLTIR